MKPIPHCGLKINGTEVPNQLNYGDKSDFLFPASPSVSLFGDTFDNTNNGLNESTISNALPRG
jgi:hypothetical protein